MSLKLTSDEFSFESPAGWTRSPHGEQLTFTDGCGGMLVISSTRVISDEPADASSILERALADAFAIVRRAASDRGMEQVSELHPSKHRNLRCWVGEAQLRDGAVLLSQCVLASQRGVLWATLETPPPESSHREMFKTFVRSVYSSDLRAIIRHVRRTPPSCIANAAPKLDHTEPATDRPDDEQFGTTFWLGCPCACRETAVLCYSAKVGSDVLNLSPLALRCGACNRVTEIFDPDLHGHDAAVSGEGAAMRGGPGERRAYRCTTCGHELGEAVATFSFNDVEGLQSLPDDLAGREQDAFDWFTIEWRCAGCGEIESIADYELA